MTASLTENPAQALRNAMRAVRCLDYTIVFARDLPAMRRFYGETLGFTLQRELSARWIEYRIGSNVLALTVRGNGLFDDPPPPAGALSLQLAFRVAPAEVHVCAAALRGRRRRAGPRADRSRVRTPHRVLPRPRWQRAGDLCRDLAGR